MYMYVCECVCMHGSTSFIDVIKHRNNLETEISLRRLQQRFRTSNIVIHRISGRISRSYLYYANNSR